MMVKNSFVVMEDRVGFVAMIYLIAMAMAMAFGACSCSTDEQSPSGTDQNAGGSASLTGGNGAAGGSASSASGNGALGCDARCYPECDPACASCADGKWIERIGGQVVDEQAKPLAEAGAVLCVHFPNGLEDCVAPTQTDANGALEVFVPDSARCVDHAVLAVMSADIYRTSAYCHLNLPDTQSSITVEEPFVLFQTAPAAVLPPEGETNLERTVIFADGLELDVTPDLFFPINGEYEDLAVLRLPPDTGGLCFVKDPAALTAVYGFSPTGEVDGVGFPVRIPNATNLPAGTDVALHVLGGLNCLLADDTRVEESDWVQYGTGKVSADGLMIEGDPIPCLYWLGYGPIS